VRVSGRRVAGWALAAVAAVGIAFAVGIATAPNSEAPAAPGAAAPGAIELPQLHQTAALPDLVVEATASETAEAPEAAAVGGEVVETAPEEAPAPITESGGSAGGGESSGGSAGGGEALEGDGL
jgi:hypothetical protein